MGLWLSVFLGLTIVTSAVHGEAVDPHEDDRPKVDISVRPQLPPESEPEPVAPAFPPLGSCFLGRPADGSPEPPQMLASLLAAPPDRTHAVPSRAVRNRPRSTPQATPKDETPVTKQEVPVTKESPAPKERSAQKDTPVAKTTSPERGTIPSMVCESPTTGHRVEYFGPEDSPQRLIVYRDGVKAAEYQCDDNSTDCTGAIAQYWSEFSSTLMDFVKETLRGGRARPLSPVQCRRMNG